MNTKTTEIKYRECCECEVAVVTEGCRCECHGDGGEEGVIGEPTHDFSGQQATEPDEPMRPDFDTRDREGDTEPPPDTVLLDAARQLRAAARLLRSVAESGDR
jgi:hypothetical protein